jgi:DNA-binding transcriptional regulator YiaG
MARLLITDVTLLKTDAITAHVRLRGGQTHSLHLPAPLAAWQLRQTPTAVVSAIDQLLDDHTDAQIAAILSARGLTSGTGQPLHARLIRQIRTHYQLPSHTQRLRDAGLLSLAEIARRLGIHPNTVKKWRNDGLAHRAPGQRQGRYLYQLPGPDLTRPRTGRPPRRPGPTTTTKTTAASRTTGGAV